MVKEEGKKSGGKESNFLKIATLALKLLWKWGFRTTMEQNVNKQKKAKNVNKTITH